MTRELTAIILALQWIEDYLPVSVVILSDSMSALQAIKNKDKSSLVIEISEKLTQLSVFGIDIQFE